MNDTVQRSGRPKITDQEAQALYRLARTHDGRTFLARLERIKAKIQDDDLRADGDASAKNKGRVMEIVDLQREFRDAQPGDRKPKVNQQNRFK